MNALILVDLQNDFLPGGALAVPNGDAVISVANELMPLFYMIIATQDWHPENHGSFAANHPGAQPGNMTELGGLPQVLWPVHCVQNKDGAAFAPGLNSEKITDIIQKGTDPGIDSYSGFYDNGHRQATGLESLLKSHGVKKIFILGLATDYCVKFTAIDGSQLGFDTYLVADGCRGVELRDGDIAHAMTEMRQAGVKIISSKEVSQHL